MKKLALSSIVLLSGVAFANEPCCIPPEKPFPKIQNCRDYNIFGIGEFIYWRFSAPNLAYARSGANNTVAITAPGTTFLPDFDYDPGFRVGMGIKFGPNKAFDIVGYYTWLHSNPKGSVSGSPIGNGFVPNNWLNSATLATNSYTFAGVDLKLHFNYVEVQSGYGFAINRYFALRPYIALTSYIIDGDLDAHYEFTTPGAAVFHIGKTHADCDTWSIGPKTGIDFVYHVTENWGIFSNFNITQQITNDKLSLIETDQVPATGANIVIQNGRLEQNRNIGLFGLEIGPTWDEWFCDYTYHVYVRATYGASTLTGGANLSFLNNSDLDIGVNGEFRGLNVRALFEF